MGKKSKQVGDGFEKVIEIYARHQDYEILRIPNATKAVRGPGGRPIWIREKSPFDYVLFGERAVAFDVKYVSQKTFSRSMINPDQLREVTRIGRKTTTGYIIYFAPIDSVYFFHWTIMQSVWLRKEKNLNTANGLYLGSLQDFKFSPIFEYRS